MFLDTYGPALEAIWGFWPNALQMNRREAGMRLGRPANDDDVVDLLRSWRRRGVACGVVTDGPDPAFFLFGDVLYRAAPPEIEVVNPIGSGDSLLAGLVDSWLTGKLDPEEAIRHAMACAAANASVWDAGAIEPEAVERLAEQVEVEVEAP